ncbi:hypothetical protein OPS25_02020 [Alteromonas ponticola]|uniref:PEP-CTERM sorting domain-containing protein n=1 Tax=Alteromonas aquimaris TaxID=2998417 RepID=A0ABT3P449_9ALTE|nr:hypothetical protein [Alteromonas aquimaris]MCW8107280.1 hypothetical protein [Alteromonas aquimaris]
MLKKIVVRSVVGISAVLALSAQVTQAQPLAMAIASCSLSDVTLEAITNVGTGDPAPGNGLLSQSYDASVCINNGDNDDAGGRNEPDPNIGQLGDGYLNGEEHQGSSFDAVANGLITASDLEDLDNNGTFTDPGYIHLAHFGENVVDGKLERTYYSDVGFAGNTFNVGDFLSIDFMCDQTDECKSGTWSLKLSDDPNVIADIQDALGRPAIFDQLVFTIKAGAEQSGAGLAIYMFDFDDIFAVEDNPALNFTTPYEFYGTFSTAGLLDKGISHLNVWARDPVLTGDVSTPATAGLLMLSLFALRRKLRK